MYIAKNYLREKGIYVQDRKIMETVNKANSENTKRVPNAGFMLGQRRRRWPNIKPALGQRLVFKHATLSLTQHQNNRTVYLHFFHIMGWKSWRDS